MDRKLIYEADTIWTGRKDGNEILKNGWIYIEENVIKDLGEGEVPSQYMTDKVEKISGKGKVFLPGLINTHHHLYQTFTRGLKSVQDAKLFDWLVGLYEIWGEFDSEGIYLSAKVGLAELILSGCTTTTDHLYLFPNGSTLEDEIKAAMELGIRFQPARGCMTLGKSQGGLPPDSVVQSEDEILEDSERLLKKFHNPDKYAMLRIVLGPCSPFSVTERIMRETAHLARKWDKVLLHTHVAETKDEEDFCIEKFGARPVAYMEKLEWLGADVWWAHSIWVNPKEIELMAKTRTGVAHCPSSNMRLGSGIAPIREMLDAGVKVSLAVDGSSSNDSSHMLAEARQALLLQRVKKGAEALKVKEALQIATKGGAEVLNREDELGMLEKGYAADIIAYKIEQLPYCTASAYDPVGTLLLCHPLNVDFSMINGRVVVDDGKLLTGDVDKITTEGYRYVNSRIKKIISTK
jgi:8-oxoguanine deaminase